MCVCMYLGGEHDGIYENKHSVVPSLTLLKMVYLCFVLRDAACLTFMTGEKEAILGPLTKCPLWYPSVDFADWSEGLGTPVASVPPPVQSWFRLPVTGLPHEACWKCSPGEAGRRLPQDRGWTQGGGAFRQAYSFVNPPPPRCFCAVKEADGS